MKRNGGHDGDGSKLGNASGSIPSPRPDDSPKAEEKRLRARRRILKGGVGGMTAVILSVYQRPSRAFNDNGNVKDQSSNASATVQCQLQDGGQREVAMSVCASIGKLI